MKRFAKGAGFSAVAAAAIVLIVAGCGGGSSYTYENTMEKPKGPGLFSGKDGEFVIFSKAGEKDPKAQ